MATIWQVDAPWNAEWALRSVTLQNPNTPGFVPLQSLANTNARTTFMAMAAAGLPFRVRVYLEVEAMIGVDEFGEGGRLDITRFQLPPVTINPRGEMNNSFADLRRIVEDSMRYKVMTMEDTPSGWRFLSIQRLDFMFVAGDNLAAIQAQLPPLAGGGKQVLLPAQLKNKKCCINPPYFEKQCLRMALIAKFYDLGHNSARISEYTNNGGPKGGKDTSYRPAWKQVPIDISALPFDEDGTSAHITAIEQANTNVGIYVYGYHEAKLEGVSEWFPVMLRPAQNRGPRLHEIVLLHFENHWLWIKDFNGFMSQKHNKIKGQTHDKYKYCCRCMEAIDERYKSLEQHLATCKGETEGEGFKPKVRLPSEKKPADKCVVQFDDGKKTFMRPLWGAADLETFWNTSNAADKVVGENSEIASIGLHLVGEEGFIPEPEFQCCVWVQMPGNTVRSYHAGGSHVDVPNSDCFKEFIRRAFSACIDWGRKRRSIEDQGMTPQEYQKFRNAAECEHCGKTFDSIAVCKVRDHDHLSGKYRAALCEPCNKKAKQPVELLILTHNGTGFDHHFYLRGLADLQNGPDGEMTLSEFTGKPLHKSFRETKKIRQWAEPRVLADSCEKVRCIEFGTGFFRVKFVDSLKFWTKSLDGLVNDQLLNFAHKDLNGKPILDDAGGKKKPRVDVNGHMEVDVEAAFPDMILFHPDVTKLADREARDVLHRLCMKLPFPYKAMTDPDCWNLPPVLPKEAYFQEFKKEDIKDADYEKLQLLSARTGATSFLDTLLTYQANDILQLASIIRQQRKAFKEICGLDVLNFLGMPGAAFQACLKMSKAVFNNITSECMGNPQLALKLMEDIQQNIRGGLSCAFIPLAKANFPGLKDYEECEPPEYVHLGSLDATNLYGFCMKQPLPVGDYKLVNIPEAADKKQDYLKRLVEAYSDDSETGYMVVIDFDVPEELHDFFDFAPVSSRQVQLEELSIRQRAVKFRKLTEEQRERALKNKKFPRSMTTGCKKLVPDLKLRTQGLHIAHLKLLMSLGIRIVALHRIWSFKQGRVLSSWVDEMAARRRDAMDESTKNTLKLMVNAPYGKFLERKERGRRLRIHTDATKCRRAALKSTCDMHVKIHMLRTLPDGSVSFMASTAHAQRKAVVLDTPRMVGWAILEYAKRHVYDFYYNVLKKIFGEKLSITYTDTDSIHYRIQWPRDPAEDMHWWNVKSQREGKPPVFDLSEFARFKEGCRPFAGTVGLFKHEQGDRPMTEAAYTGPKMYAYRCEDKTTLKGKGVPQSVLERQYKTVEAYKEAILFNNAKPAVFRSMQSKDHVVQHKDMVKSCLTADNDKVFMVSPYASRPLGHVKNSLAESVEGWSAHELAEDKALKSLEVELVEEPAAILQQDEDAQTDKEDSDYEFADDVASVASEDEQD
jgi:hypothetical protein